MRVDRVPELKTSPSVAWVSFDAPVESTSYWTLAGIHRAPL
jgi:hypothetical protein